MCHPGGPSVQLDLTWLSFRPRVAGMDGNRTHQGHLNSALRTVLKTGDLPSADVHRAPLPFDPASSDSRTGLRVPLLNVHAEHEEPQHQGCFREEANDLDGGQEMICERRRQKAQPTQPR